MSNTTKKEDKGIQGMTTSQTKTNGEATATKTAPKTVEEQMKFFDGLSQLVGIKRRFEKHREAVAKLVVPTEALEQFDTDRRYNVGITLHDDAGNEYEIINPKLLKEMQEHLLATLDTKLVEFDQKIMEYGN